MNRMLLVRVHDRMNMRSVLRTSGSSLIFRRPRSGMEQRWEKALSKQWMIDHVPYQRPLPTLSLDWIWNQIKIPKGFENFFPKGGIPEKSPLDEESDANPNTNENPDENIDTNNSDHDAGEETSSPTSPITRAGRKANGSSRRRSSSNQNKNRGNPDDDNSSMMDVIFGVILALYTLRFFEVRRGLDANGEEITFQDFRKHLMQDAEKLVVVNKNLVRVFMKEGANGLPEGSRDVLPYNDPNYELTSALAGLDFLNTLVDAQPNANQPKSNSEDWDDKTQITLTSGSDLENFESESKRSHKRYHFFIGSVESLEEKLASAQSEMGVKAKDLIPVQYVTETNWIIELIKVSPYLMMILGTVLMMRSMGSPASGRSGGIFQVGKTNAKRINKEDINVTFADVAGCHEAKKEVMEFVEFLQDSTRFTKLGAKIPKGALLCGPPGTGKTLLAKAVAGEANVPFFSISGSDFLEMFVGVGPSRVRDLFKVARESAPCIIFIDEIDAVGRQRGRGGFSGGNDERENTLNQLLVEMDGFSPSTGVVVLAGTNRPDILDQALLRPGRFDRQIQVDKPDLQGRKEIFQVHLKGINLASPIDDIAGRLAGLTPGFAGADIANLCNEAAIVAARRKGESVTIDDFEKATDRIIGGLESNKIMSEQERSIVAYHEAGHAVAGWFLEHTDPVLKVTIIPRTSGALGYAQYLPKETFLRSQDQILDVVCMALAGRAAEEVFLGSVTTGASDDLRRVTQMVYSTIKDYGMNSRVGQFAFPQNESGVPGDRPYSDATARAIDEEARAIVDTAYQRTLELIRERKAEVEKVAMRLLDKETITHDEILDLVGPRPFEGDALYKEYVSSRHATVREEESKQAEEKKDDSVSDEMLTPGLA